MKIGIFADTHVGRCIPRAIGELRRTAFRHAFTEAINIFIEEGIGCLIHAGDVFEKRSMTPKDSVFVKEELQRLVDSIHNEHEKDMMMFAVRGNHDGAPESNALDYIKHPLARYLKVIGDGILQGKKEVQVHRGICIVGVAHHPYIFRKFQDIKPVLKEILATNESEMKLLVIHNFIQGYHQIPPGVPQHSFLTVEDFDDLDVDMVIAGHYHTKKDPADENGLTLLTPGATEAIDLSDEGPFGVYILEEKKSIRFIPIKPIHEIRNIRITSQEAVKPIRWFIDNASEEVNSYASSLQARGIGGVLRLILLGLTDGDPHRLEQPLMSEFDRIKEKSPNLLHVELVNRIENVHQPVILPTLGGGAEFAAEILKPLGNSTQEAMRIVEEVGITLDEKASQKTGLLTGSDRRPFVTRWVDLLEETEDQG